MPGHSYLLSERSSVSLVLSHTQSLSVSLFALNLSLFHPWHCRLQRTQIKEEREKLPAKVWAKAFTACNLALQFSSYYHGGSNPTEENSLLLKDRRIRYHSNPQTQYSIQSRIIIICASRGKVYKTIIRHMTNLLFVSVLYYTLLILSRDFSELSKNNVTGKTSTVL